MTKEEFFDILDEMGERLSGPAEHLFELAVQRVITGRIVTLVVVAIAAYVGVRAWRWIDQDHADELARYEREMAAYKAQPKDRWYYGRLPEIDPSMLYGGRIALIAVAVLTTMFFVIPSVIDLLNPEWAALGRIAGSIR